MAVSRDTDMRLYEQENFRKSILSLFHDETAVLLKPGEQGEAKRSGALTLRIALGELRLLTMQQLEIPGNCGSICHLMVMRRLFVLVAQ